MANDPTPVRLPAAVWWLVGANVAVGLGSLAVAIVPLEWLERVAERAGHADDLTPERITRLRILGSGLALSHFLLAGLLGTLLRSSTVRVISQLSHELRIARPITGVRRAVALITLPGPFHVVALTFVLVIASVIRLKYLNIPIDYDEAYSFLNFARRPLYQGLADYNTTNNHLLNTLFMHIAYNLFGQQEWALRLHVFAAGVGLILATYVLGRAIGGPDIGIVAAAMVAVSGVMVNYSVNARGYVWVAWMTVLLMLATWRMATATVPLAVDWIAAWMTSVIGLFAIPTMVYPLVGCFGWLSVRTIKMGQIGRGRLGSLMMLGALVALATIWLYAPALVFRGIAAWQHPFVSPLLLRDWMLHDHLAWGVAIRSWAEGPGPWELTVIVAMIGLGVWWFKNRLSLSLIAAVPIATWVLTAVQRLTPPPRVFSFLMPLFALVAAAAVVAICSLFFRASDSGAARKSRATPGTACSVFASVLCIWGLLHTRSEPLPGGESPTYLVEDVVKLQSKDEYSSSHRPRNQLWRLDVKEVVATIELELRAGDRVLAGLPADLPLHFYTARRGWSVPIGGEPRQGERLFLVVPGNQDPRIALRENLSLRFTDPWLLQAKWQLVAAGELAIWRAHPPALAATGSISP